MKYNKIVFRNYIFSIALILGLFLPHNNAIFQIIHGLLPLALFIIYYSNHKYISTPTIKFFIVSIIILSFTINIFIGNNLETKDFSRLLSFMLLFFLFPYISVSSISNKLLYSLLTFIFFSQIAYVLNIGFLVNIFETYYPYVGDVRGFSSDYLLNNANDINFIVNKRYAGLYHNPNQTVRYVSLLLTVFYIENKKSNLISVVPFIIIALLSVILSGSRTGLVVIAMLTVAYFLFIKDSKHKKKGIVYFVVVLFSIAYLTSGFFDSGELRSLKVESGLTDSLQTKINWFLGFFHQLNSVWQFVFGHFTSNNITEFYGIPLLDSEWGELFYCFGFLGFVTITLFYVNLWRTKDSRIRFFLIILLWGITSTVLFSFRMSFVFMLLLSKYYSDYLNLKTQNELFHLRFQYAPASY